MTGVQTCALPILPRNRAAWSRGSGYYTVIEKLADIEIKDDVDEDIDVFAVATDTSNTVVTRIISY